MIQEKDITDDGMWVTTTVFLMRLIAEQMKDLEGILSMREVRYVNPSHFVLEEWLPGVNPQPERDQEFESFWLD